MLKINTNISEADIVYYNYNKSINEKIADINTQMNITAKNRLAKVVSVCDEELQNIFGYDFTIVRRKAMGHVVEARDLHTYLQHENSIIKLYQKELVNQLSHVF